MRQYQSGNQTRRVRALNLADPVPHAELHPDLARRHGIEASDMVELRTPRGCSRFRAVLTDTVRVDTIFVPFHWGGRHSANALTDPTVDPLSKMPAFKACAVSVSRVSGPDGVDVPLGQTDA
jgi:assimilatory nitrate reductase catalytic subunit